MYFGHFAAAVAIKAKEPEVPAAPIMIGTGVLDIIYGVTVMTGVNKVTPNPKASPNLYVKVGCEEVRYGMI